MLKVYEYASLDFILVEGLIWCERCHHFSGICCLHESFIGFKRYWRAVADGYTLDDVHVKGAILVPPERVFEFIDLVNDERLILHKRCDCRGHCLDSTKGLCCKSS